MTEKLWAANEDEEMWHHMDPEDAAQELLESVSQEQEISVGDKFTIYCGECHYPKPSEYLPHVASHMIDNAAEAAGDGAEDWLTGCDEELQRVIANTVDQWCDVHGQMPKFGTMQNIKAVEIIVTKVNEYDCNWDFVNQPSA